MSVTLRYGNIFEGCCETIAIPVNCVGVMGKGLALQYKQKHPNGFDMYKKMCDSREIRPGVCGLIKEKNGSSFLMFPTKNDWKLPSKLEYVDEGLECLKANYRNLGIKSIALPALGCGLGGLKWADVKKLVFDKFSGEKLNVILYVPADVTEVAPFAFVADTMAPVEVKEALVDCVVKWFQKAGVYDSPKAFEAMRILYGRAYALLINHSDAVERVKKDHGKAMEYVEKAIGLTLISNAY